MQAPPSLAIIEDQAPIREALCDYLGAQPEFDCVLIAVLAGYRVRYGSGQHLSGSPMEPYGDKKRQSGPTSGKCVPS